MNTPKLQEPLSACEDMTDIELSSEVGEEDCDIGEYDFVEVPTESLSKDEDLFRPSLKYRIGPFVEEKPIEYDIHLEECPQFGPFLEDKPMEYGSNLDLQESFSKMCQTERLDTSEKAAGICPLGRDRSVETQNSFETLEEIMSLADQLVEKLGSHPECALEVVTHLQNRIKSKGIKLTDSRRVTQKTYAAAAAFTKFGCKGSLMS
ncbi:MAG: hypothetical protein SGCHY_000441 [Lobulomycetales sp.]